MSRDEIPRMQIQVMENEWKGFHEELEVLFLLEGTVSVEAGCDKWLMEKEDIIVINSAIRHSVIAVQKESILCRFMIPHKLIGRYIDSDLYLIWCNSVSDKETDYSKIRMMLKDIVRYYLLKKKYDLYYQGKFYEMLYCLIEEYLITNEDIRYRERISKEDERVAQILSYVQENYNRDISLKELAKQLYLTDAYLSRFFKKVLGVNFWEYLNTVKLHYVVEDLLYSTKSITRIAMDNGFTNMATFNKSFRNVYHITPSEYRAVMGPRKLEERKSLQEKEKQILQRLNYRMQNSLEIPEEEIDEKYSAEIDMDQRKDYSRPWKKLLNVGTMALLKDYRVRSELLRVNSSLKISYVRFWNVLSNAMGLGIYKTEELLDYDFHYLNECLDFLIQNHLKPVFHMGYKKTRLGSGVYEEEYTYVENLFSFKSLREMGKVFEIMLKHLIMRYGREEVDTWYFELWYPNVYYKLPEFLTNEGEDSYSVELFKIIRRMLPETKVGLAEFSLLTDSEKLYERLSNYKKQGIVPDFISCVSYPYRVTLENDKLTREWHFDDDFMIHEIKNLKSIMHQVGLGNLPIWLTEYNFTILNRNPLNDTRFKGAWILKNMADVAELVEAAGHWQLSDLCSLPIGGEHNRLLYGGSGLITKDGFNKPSYFALYFLSLLKPFLVARGKHFLLTADKQDTYAMVIFNMKSLGTAAYMKSETDITLDDMEHIFENEKNIHVQLHLNGIKQGKYRIKCLTIDSEHGAIQDWISRNKQVSVLKANEIWHLQQACMPDMRIYTEFADQVLNIEATVGANDFIYYEIELVN